MGSQDIAKANEYEEHGRNAVAVVQDFAIQTQDDMNRAAGMRQELKDRQKAITGFLEPHIKAAHEAHKSLTSRREELLKPFEDAEKVLNGKMVDWQTEEDARIAKEQKEADDEAVLEAAAEAQESGNKELSEAILEGDVVVAAAPVEKQKTNGVTFSVTYDYEVVDEDKIPREYLMPNDKAIKAMVKAKKDKTMIPGIKVFPKKNVKSVGSGMSKRSW
jgi:hypothetical protein